MKESSIGPGNAQTLAVAPSHAGGSDPDDGERAALGDALVAKLVAVTSRRALWDRVRPIRYGSSVTSYAEFNVLMQALGRAGTLRRMITTTNRDRVKELLRGS